MVCDVAVEHPFLDANNAAAAAAAAIRGGSLPYWTLANPVIYKLRTCCLRDFIPEIPNTPAGTNNPSALDLYESDDGNGNHGVPPLLRRRSSSHRRMSNSSFDNTHLKDNIDSAENSANGNNNTPASSAFFKAVKLDLPPTGVAYVLRGRKYLLVENVANPASRYMIPPPPPDEDEDEESELEEEDIIINRQSTDDDDDDEEVPATMVPGPATPPLNLSASTLLSAQYPEFPPEDDPEDDPQTSPDSTPVPIQREPGFYELHPFNNIQ
ncbi:hypothetical protein HK102_002986, partial [Quaeritorhiza haematococci]